MGACSKKKWDVKATNAGPSKVKVNSTEVAANSTTGSLGTLEKDASITVKISAQLTDQSWSDEKSFSVKATTDPANDKDVLPLGIGAVPTSDSTVNITLTGAGVEIK